MERYTIELKLDANPPSIHYTLRDPTSEVIKIAKEAGYSVDLDAAKRSLRTKAGGWFYWEAPLYKEVAEEPKATKLPRCPRPTKPGYYLCQLDDGRWGRMDLKLESGELYYFAFNEYFPLRLLKETAKIWGPVEFE